MRPARCCARRARPAFRSGSATAARPAPLVPPVRRHAVGGQHHGRPTPCAEFLSRHQAPRPADLFRDAAVPPHPCLLSRTRSAGGSTPERNGASSARRRASLPRTARPANPQGHTASWIHSMSGSAHLGSGQEVAMALAGIAALFSGSKAPSGGRRFPRPGFPCRRAGTAGQASRSRPRARWRRSRRPAWRRCGRRSTRRS